MNLDVLRAWNPGICINREVVDRFPGKKNWVVVHRMTKSLNVSSLAARRKTFPKARRLDQHMSCPTTEMDPIPLLVNWNLKMFGFPSRPGPTLVWGSVPNHHWVSFRTNWGEIFKLLRYKPLQSQLAKLQSRSPFPNTHSPQHCGWPEPARIR
jgi:hypothetical protein